MQKRVFCDTDRSKPQPAAKHPPFNKCRRDIREPPGALPAKPCFNNLHGQDKSFVGYA